MSLLTEKTFDGTAVRISYAEGPGDGPPLVLLHGFGCWWQTWLHLIPGFCLRWHVYAVDLPGHGKSGPSKTGYGRAGYASHVAEFLRAVVGEPAVLVGNSLGAVISAIVAADSPELAKAVILEDPPLFMEPGPGPSEVRSKFYDEYELLGSAMSSDELIEGFRAIYPEADGAEIRDTVRSRSVMDREAYGPLIGRADPELPGEALLRRIRVPALLVHADPELGGIVSEEGARRAAGLIGDCTVVHVRGVGHLIHRERPVEFARVVTDYLESL